MTALTLNLKPFVATLDQFYELCASNPDLRIERSMTGEVIIMPPTNSLTGSHNMSISGQLWLWNEQSQLGIVFDSSSGFHLPNSADRSPDAPWIAQDSWGALTLDEQSQFAPICPDFVVELRSVSDCLEPLQTKMLEYMANGAQLGWLIDPSNRRVEICRAGQPLEILENPETVSGEPLLPGFQLKLSRIFS